MDLYKYNTIDFLNEEISFSEVCSYFYTVSLSNAFDGEINLDYSYEDTYMNVLDTENGIELYFYTNLSFVCDLSEIEGIEGTPYFESLNLFQRLNNEIDKLLFDNNEIEIINFGGTLLNTSVTTKQVTYGLSLTCVILFFIGIITGFKKLLQLIGGR